MSECRLLYINSFDFENHRACAVVAACYHDMVVFHPPVHDTSALQCRVDITADTIPGFRAEWHSFRAAVLCPGFNSASFIGLSAFHESSCATMPKVIPFIVSAEYKFIALIVARTLSAAGIFAILSLQFRKQFLINNSYFTPVFHNNYIVRLYLQIYNF